MARRILSTQLALLCLLSFPQVTFADPPAEETEWGDLTGQLIYDGEPPKPQQLPVKPGFPPALDESLVVYPKTRGLMNVFVYLRPGSSEEQPLRIHPDHIQEAKTPVHWFVDKWGYTPHAIFLQTDRTLLLHHKADVAFNLRMHLFVNVSPGNIIPPMATAKYHFSKSERLPSPAGCNIHPWFSGYLLILGSPYGAVTDKNGRFTIRNLPVGEHEFQLWQEIPGYLPLPEIKLRESALEGDRKRGRLIVDIKPGDNELGEIKIDPQVFE